MKKNTIAISQKPNETIIEIDEEAEHEEIVKELKRKMENLSKMYQEEKTPIKVIGKVLKTKEIEEIQRIITEKIPVEIEFDTPKDLGLHGIKKAFEKEIETSETKFYKGSLRSGQKVEYEGSIVITGDVNGGSEVIAGENIAVIGAIRGLAHAGAKGNKKAIITASSIEAPQLRIANIVKEMEKERTRKIKLCLCKRKRNCSRIMKNKLSKKHTGGVLIRQLHLKDTIQL